MPKVADLYADIRANTSGFKKGVAEVKNAFKDMAKSFNVDTTEFEKVIPQLTLAGTVATALGGVVLTSTKRFLEYSNEVGKLSRTIGATSEESSRLLQITEGLGIENNTLTKSLETAISKGYEPTIENIKAMSDAYNLLETDIEKTDFVTKAFGKTGSDMGLLLELGSEGIDKNSKAINANLILTEEQVLTGKLAEKQIRTLSGAWDGFTTSVGSGFTRDMYRALTPLDEKVSDLEDFGRELNNQNLTLPEYTENITKAADQLGLFVDEAGNLLRGDKVFKGLQQPIRKGFIADTFGKGGTTTGFLTPEQEKAIRDQARAEELLSEKLLITRNNMLLKHSVTADGISISEQYSNQMSDLKMQEGEWQKTLDEGNRKGWDLRNQKMREAVEGLANVNDQQRNLTQTFRQGFGIGIMELITAGGKNATTRTTLDIANALGLIDEKTFGVESAVYDIADAWDGASDGIIDFAGWTDTTFTKLGDLNTIARETTENLPKGGGAEFYYDIIVTTYYRTHGAAGRIGPNVGTGGANLWDLPPNPFGGKHGGSFVGLQHGGIVSPGFSNDGMMVGVSSGERITAEPAGNKNIEDGQVSINERLLFAIEGIPQAISDAVRMSV